MKATWCSPYSSRAFQWYKEWNKRQYVLQDLNIINKQNKQTTLLHKYTDIESLTHKLENGTLQNGVC